LIERQGSNFIEPKPPRPGQPTLDPQIDDRDQRVNGWLLYDASCGFCDRWVHFWKPILARRGYKIEPLQSEFAQAHVPLPDGDPLRDLRLLLADGRVIEGAHAYRHLMRRIFWAYPLYVISILPVFSSMFNMGYRWFRNHRQQVSKACGLASRQARDNP
jgi:predicted DCC family thiol-disulfide oxidoreductase YuxK